VNKLPKWVLVLIAAVALLIVMSRDFAAPIWAGAGLATIFILIMAAAALLWFLFSMCLAPRLRLRKLQHIRVRQGRRHPLA
jgi:hypothetical protein